MRALLLLAMAAAALLAQVKDFKPSRLNVFSPQQDIEIGKEAAAEVRRTMPVVNNPDLTGYVQRIGNRLAKSKRAQSFPFSFEVINDPTINAFALPGGPMFVHTGLLAALDNESQLAGVLAHEMSHVTLRHGTSQVSKANLLQLGVMIGTAGMGNSSLWSRLGQLGIGLGANSLLLRYSRDAEKEADLNGAQIMHEVGYDPSQMARFFQKLESGDSDNSRLVNFLSDHPTPGNRVKYVEDQNRYLPKRSYTESEPQTLPRIKQIVASLPGPPQQARPAAAPAPAVYPSGNYKTHQGRGFSLEYPDNWDVFGEANSPTVTIAPKSTLVTDRNGRIQIGYGLIAAFYYPSGGKTNLERDTAALLRQIMSQNPSMRQVGQARNLRVGGRDGILTPLESDSPYSGNAGRQRESDMLLTVPHVDGLFYIVFIAPESDWKATQPAFDRAVASLRLTN